MPANLTTAPPSKWVSLLTQTLQPGENLVAWLETDLDLKHRYAPLLLVLTSERFLLLALDSTEAIGQWPRATVQQLHSREQHGLGQLRIVGNESLLGAWRYTAARGPAAARFV